MKKITVQSFKAIFDFLPSDPHSVLWMRSIDFQRQLYISPNYEQVWSHTSEQLYEHPASWNDYLYREDHETMITKINARPVNQEVEAQPVFFRIIGLQNKIQFIKDQPFALITETNQIVAFGGISEVLPEQQWHLMQDIKNISCGKNKQVEKSIFGILQNEMRLLANHDLSPPKAVATHNCPLILNKHGQPLSLTKRELECLSHLLKGQSAKQTAALMNISTRTAEFHINSLKEKAKCRTKLELLSKVII